MRKGLRYVIHPLLGAGLIALCAQVSLEIPGAEVPITLQTLAILCLAFWLEPVRAGLAIGYYLLAGAIGLPVFAEAGYGWERLIGPSVGFFLGFGVAMVWVSMRYRAKRVTRFLFLKIFSLFLMGHIIILGLGWIGLAWHIGSEGLWERTFVPLLPGLLIKSFAGSLLIMLGRVRLSRE